MRQFDVPFGQSFAQRLGHGFRASENAHGSSLSGAGSMSVLAFLTAAHKGQTMTIVHSPFPKERAAGCTADSNGSPFMVEVNHPFGANRH